MLTTTTNLIDSGYLDWPGARQLLRLERTTTERGQTRTSVTYAISSLPRERADAKVLLSLMRGRWEIENRAFYVLDTALKEDANRSRSRVAPQVLSAIRQAALNLSRRLGRGMTELLREHALKPDVLFARLGILKK